MRGGILKRIWLGVSVLLVAYVLSGIFSFYSLKMVQNTLADYRKEHSVIIESSRMLLENILQQMDFYKRAVRSGDKNEISQAHSCCKSALKAIDIMQEAKLEGSTRAKLAALKKKILVYEKDAMAFCEWLFTTGDDAEKDGRMHEVEDEGVALLRETRLIIDGITSYHLAEIDRLSSAISRRKRLEVTIMILGFALSVFLVSWILDRTIMKPMSGLMTCFAMGAGGNYDTRMRENSPGEIGILARYFNYFMDRIDKDNAKLQHEIAERKDAEQRKEELLKKLSRAEHFEAITVLAGGVAREIGAVLRPIVNLPDKIITSLDGAAEGDPDSILKLKQEIVSVGKVAERAAATVDDLMSLGGLVDAGKFPEDINLLIDEFLVSYELSMVKEQYPGISVSKDLANDVAKVMVSPEHIMRMLNHLCVNAFESMAAEGGSMTIRTFPVALKEELSGYEVIAPGKYTVVSVSDTGKGVSSKHLGRIFDPFFTLHDDEHEAKTGMGLSVVHGIIKDHGGFIDVETEQGSGASFFLYFPVIKEESEND